MTWDPLKLIYSVHVLALVTPSIYTCHHDFHPVSVIDIHVRTRHNRQNFNTGVLMLKISP